MPHPGKPEQMYGGIDRLSRLWELWNQEARALPQPQRGEFQQSNDPLQSIMQLQRGYGQNVDPNMLLRFLQLGQGIAGEHSSGVVGNDMNMFMQLIQALLATPQMKKGK